MSHITTFPVSQTVEIDYTNWRGERSVRRIVPDRIQWTANNWHKETQWLLRAWDEEKHDFRDFAVKDIHSWRPALGKE